MITKLKYLSIIGSIIALAAGCGDASNARTPSWSSVSSAVFEVGGQSDAAAPVVSAPVFSAHDAIDQIEACVTREVAKKSGAEMRELMIGHYLQLRLMNAEGWASPKLAEITEDLLPSDVSETEGAELIKRMGACAQTNGYLCEALDSIGKAQMPDLQRKCEQDGAEVFPDVVAYAMVLDRLTNAFKRDPQLLIAVDDVWEAALEHVSVAKHLSLFKAIKYYSVGHLSGIRQAVETGVVAPDYLNIALPVNIFEAGVTDVCRRNFGNARAAWELGTHRPGGPLNEATGAGPAYIAPSKDGHPALNLCAPMPKLWADLYGAWNLAFVAAFSDYPYVMVKLLIPSVADYADQPTEYIYGRALALYVHMRRELFAAIDRGSSQPNEGWPSHEFIKTFGAANKRAAKHYRSEVKKAEHAVEEHAGDE